MATRTPAKRTNVPPRVKQAITDILERAKADGLVARYILWVEREDGSFATEAGVASANAIDTAAVEIGGLLEHKRTRLMKRKLSVKR